jgi:hypothetical protein
MEWARGLESASELALELALVSESALELALASEPDQWSAVRKDNAAGRLAVCRTTMTVPL